MHTCLYRIVGYPFFDKTSIVAETLSSTTVKREFAHRSDSAAAIKEWPEQEASGPVSYGSAGSRSNECLGYLRTIMMSSNSVMVCTLPRFFLPFSFPPKYHLIVQFIARNRTISESGRMGARNNDLHKDDDFLVSSMVRCNPVIRTRSPSGQT